MAKLTKQAVTLVEFDTDNFTAAQWKKFIADNVRYKDIAEAVSTDLFPLDKLKEIALRNYQQAQNLMEIL